MQHGDQQPRPQRLGVPAVLVELLAAAIELGHRRRRGALEPHPRPQGEIRGERHPPVAALLGEQSGRFVGRFHRTDEVATSHADLGRSQQARRQLGVLALRPEHGEGVGEHPLGVVEQGGVGESAGVVGLQPRHVHRRVDLAVPVLRLGELAQRGRQVALQRAGVGERRLGVGDEDVEPMLLGERHGSTQVTPGGAIAPEVAERHAEVGAVARLVHGVAGALHLLARRGHQLGSTGQLAAQVQHRASLRQQARPFYRPGHQLGELDELQRAVEIALASDGEGEARVDPDQRLDVTDGAGDAEGVLEVGLGRVESAGLALGTAEHPVQPGDLARRQSFAGRQSARGRRRRTWRVGDHQFEQLVDPRHPAMGHGRRHYFRVTTIASAPR